jgi:hypothetical protein
MMTRRKARQARRNLALAAGRALEMLEVEERITQVGFASVSRVEAARREVELCATSEALDQHGTIFDYAASKEASRSLAQLRSVWNESASGPQRCQEQREARAEPSGSRGVGCGGEPRISRLEPGERQWGVDYAVTDSNFPFAAYVDEVVKVRFLGGLGVLCGIYPSF